MIPFPTPMMAKPAEVGGGGDTQWRWLFPNGAPNGSVRLYECEMFLDDESTTDQCTGGTASASGSAGVTVPANAFDDNFGSVWISSTNAGSWLKYTFPSTKVIQSIRFYTPNNIGAGYTPNDITLQYGGANTTGIAWTGFDNGLAIYHRGNSDGSVETGYSATEMSGAASSSSFAAKGNIYDVTDDLTIADCTMLVSPVAGETYKLVLVSLDTGTDLIDAILGESSVWNAPSTALQLVNFTLDSPVAVTSGDRIGFLLVRTGSTSTAICRLVFSTTAYTGSVLSFYKIARYASNNPTVGDDPIFESTSRACITAKYNYTP